MTAGRLIGKITFEHPFEPGRRLSATLSATAAEGYRWACEDAELQRSLNTMYPVEDDSPAVGVPGHAQLHAAAKLLQGEVEAAPVDDDPPGTVY